MKTSLVLAGGGHSHLAVLRHFAIHPVPELELTLISREQDSPYSGALGACIAGHIDVNDMQVNLPALAAAAGARFIRDTIEGLDTAAATVLLANASAVPYSVLSVNTGSAPATREIPGADRHACPVKPISAFLDHWHRLRRCMEEDPFPPFRIAFIGAGVAGVELALSMRHALAEILRRRGLSPSRLEFHLLDSADRLLEPYPERFRRLAFTALQTAGITVHNACKVSAVEENCVYCENESPLPVDRIFLTTSASAPEWPARAGLETDPQGFITVNPYLQSVSHDTVFAAGDIAFMRDSPRAKSGVIAVRQGGPLSKNLSAFCRNKAMKPFRPRQKALVLMGTGGKHALATRGDWASSGRPYWWLKRYLDKRFVRRYSAWF